MVTSKLVSATTVGRSVKATAAGPSYNITLTGLTADSTSRSRMGSLRLGLDSQKLVFHRLLLHESPVVDPTAPCRFAVRKAA